MPHLRDRSTWFHGDSAHCLQPPSAQRPRRLVLIGPPGAGKHTQSALLADALGACPLSTSELFRASYDHSFPPGSAAAEAFDRINRGQLVPDDVVLQLLRDRRACLRCAGGFILVGFPRTLAQAHALDALLAFEHLQLDAVLSYELPSATLAERLTGRVVCSHCHAVFHLMSHPPCQSGICDRCGGPLEQLREDQPESVQIRLSVHAEAAAPVLAHYARLNLLLRIDSTGSPEEIFQRTLDALAKHSLSLSRA